MYVAQGSATSSEAIIMAAYVTLMSDVFLGFTFIVQTVQYTVKAVGSGVRLHLAVHSHVLSCKWIIVRSRVRDSTLTAPCIKYETKYSLTWVTNSNKQRPQLQACIARRCFRLVLEVGAHVQPFITSLDATDAHGRNAFAPIRWWRLRWHVKKTLFSIFLSFTYYFYLNLLHRMSESPLWPRALRAHDWLFWSSVSVKTGWKK